MKNSDSSVLSQFAPEGTDIPLCGFDTEEKGKPLPKELRVTVEQLSGFDMSDVCVHYDSPLPEKFNARAFAYGTDIYLGPGTEETLAHEAWHVVQQKQRRVKVTCHIYNFLLNYETYLEKEAELMARRLQLYSIDKVRGMNYKPRHQIKIKALVIQGNVPLQLT